MRNCVAISTACPTVTCGDLVGVYEIYADALQRVYERADLKPFLVKRISTTEAVSYFTLDLAVA